MLSDEVVIVPYPDGPYLVRGAFNLRDHEGAAIETKRRTVALCRCGKSRLRPFCDGTHQLIRFQAASGRETAPVSKSRPRAEPRGSRSTNGHGAEQPAKRQGPEQPVNGNGFDRSIIGHGTDSLQPQRRCADALGDGNTPAAIASIGQDLSQVRRNLATLLDASCAGRADSAVGEAAALLAAAAALLESGDRDG